MALLAALTTIVDGHEVLRSRLDRATMTLHPGPAGDALTEVPVSGDMQTAVGDHTARRSTPSTPNAESC